MNNGYQQCTTTKPTTPDGPVHIQFTDLNEDTNYRVVVQARNESGYGPPSNIMNVKTPVPGKCFPRPLSFNEIRQLLIFSKIYVPQSVVERRKEYCH